MENTKRITNILIYVILINMTISLAFALGEGMKNLLLIFVMCLSPIVLLRYLGIKKNEVWLILFIISLILSPLLHQPDTLRWETIGYSLLFCMTFMAYTRLLDNSDTKLETYTKVLKWLIYAYTIVLLIQQFCVLTGLPIFNLGYYDPGNKWKLNSLTSEVSHSARYIGLLMYSYIIVREIALKRRYSLTTDLKEDKLLWISFFWSMLTMVSATAFIFIFIVFSKFFNKKNAVYILAVGLVIVVAASILEITTFQRAQRLVTASFTLDEETILKADHSGSYRILPMIIAAKEIDLSTSDGWFGKGIDYMESILYKRIPGTLKGYKNGGMLMIAVEYGFLTFLFFFLFTVKTIIRRNDFITYILWFLLVFSLSLNMQLLWCTLILLYTNHYFLNKNKELNA